MEILGFTLGVHDAYEAGYWTSHLAEFGLTGIQVHLAIERLLARLRACHPHWSRSGPAPRSTEQEDTARAGRLYCRTAVCNATNPTGALSPPPPPPPPPPLFSLLIRLSSLRRSRGYDLCFPVRSRCRLTRYRLSCSCGRCFRLSR